MAELEYQWPSSKFVPKIYRKGSAAGRDRCGAAIVDFFRQIWGRECVVFPSARAALSAICVVEVVGRGQKFYAPEWSSHCVWNSVTPYCTPQIHFDESLSIALAVHKYGHVSVARKKPSCAIVEDSCDSLVFSERALFPNDGKYEIFSLPKVMGTYAGGVLVSQDAKALRALRRLAGSFGRVNAALGHLRWRENQSAAARTLMSWEDSEYRNFSPDYSALRAIVDNLSAWEENRRVIERRLNVVRSRLGSFEAMERRVVAGRLPSAYLLPLERIEEGNRSKLMVRRVNIRGSLERPIFEPFALLPLHFGVTEARFRSLLGLVN